MALSEIAIMRPKLLNQMQIDEMMSSLPHWQIDDKRRTISTVLKFADFKQAFAFMTEIAIYAESIDHHPDWSNSYHRLSISLTTHDVKGLTILDEQLANAISDAALRYHANYVATQ